MFFLLALLLFIFSLQPRHAHAADIPLFYQLIEAYKPHTELPTLSLTVNTPHTETIPKTVNSPIVASAGPSSLPVGGGETGELVTIAVLGDSMIDTLGPNIFALQKAISRYYPTKKFKVLNYGAAATTIEYGLTRLTNSYQYLGKTIPSLVSQSPDIVVIESFAYNNFGNTQDGFNKHANSISSIINTIHDQLPKAKVLLASTIAPNSLTFANGAPDVQFSALEKIEKATTIKTYLQNFLDYAKNHHIPFADAYHPSLIQNEGNRQFINSKDNIHPSAYGGQFFCDTVAKALFDNHLIP